MTAFDDETLLAYVDGELEPGRAAELEAAMDADPALAERVARHAELRAVAAGAFAGALGEEVPERLVAAAAGAKVVRPAFGRPRALAMAQWAAMAACLVVGVMVGRGLTVTGPLKPVDGGLEAGGELAEALERNLAADPGAVEVGLTFRDQANAYCRTFHMEGQALAGVACREGDRWAVRLAAAAAAQTGDYRTAGAAMPPAVLAYVDSAIAGDPLDREQEIAARKAGWR